MYVEDVIPEIELANQGVTVNKITIDIILYADDIVLLSNSLKGLNSLLKITEEYEKRW